MKFNSLFFLFLTTSAFGEGFSNLENLQKSGARVSALAVNLTTGKVIAQENAGERLTPASVTKLILGAKALEVFGSEHTFKSRFYARGQLIGSTLKGDLVFEGAGDPYLTNEKLWFLATDIARLGIKSIEGNLVLNNALFAPIVADSNRAAGAKRSSHAYDSPLSASAVNFSVLAVVAGAGATPGKSGSVALEPYSLSGVRLKGGVTTGATSSVQASRRLLGNKDEISVSGSVKMGSPPVRVYRSVSNADNYAGDVLEAFLLNSGVKLKGAVLKEISAIKKTDRLLTEVEGFPLEWQIKGLMKMSNNFIADMLTIHLDGDGEKNTRLDISGGNENLARYVQSSLADSKFKTLNITPRSQVVIDSGSGLTPENRLSSLDIVAVLERMYGNTREFPAFLNSLPIPGAEGTLRRRFKNNKDLQSRMRAKTGTLTQPHDAIALAGYCRVGNEWAAFSVIVNGTAKRNSVGVALVREAMEKDLANLFPLEN